MSSPRPEKQEENTYIENNESFRNPDLTAFF